MSNEGLNNEELNDQFQVRRDKMNKMREGVSIHSVNDMTVLINPHKLLLNMTSFQKKT